MILDRFDDNGAYLKELQADLGAHDKVKLASSEARSSYAEDYALRISTPGKAEYRYQITDESEIVSSAAYFGKYGHQLPKSLQKEAASNLKAALESFKLSIPDSIEKTASMELGFTHENPELTLESLFAGDDVNVIEDAFNSCSPRGKRRLLLQVKEASAAKLDGRYGSYLSDCLGSDIKLAFDLRGLRVEGEAKETLNELFEKTASLEPEETVRRLEVFDKQNRLCHLYGRFVPDPVESVFGRSVEKVAEASEDTIEVGGSPVVTTEFEEFVEDNYETLENSFGEDFATQLKSDPVTVYNSLPVTYKKAIGSIYSKG